MSQPTEKLAVLFADVCGSTALYENLGDDLARQLIMHCLDTMSESIAQHQGTLIKTIGDEIMCVFPNVEDAFHAACAMRAAVENDRRFRGNAMHVRIGFNYGDVIHESNDVHGNTVNIAARVAMITRAGQIMTTRAVFDALPIELQDCMREVLRAEFKGLQDRIEIFQVILEKESAESTRLGIPAYRKSPENNHELVLRYRGQSVMVNKERRSVILGREESCDLIVQNDLASRMHCRIELRFGQFVIADQSTNGTFIRTGGDAVAHLSREEVVLHGNGSISLGQTFAEHPTDIVEFAIISAQRPH